MQFPNVANMNLGDEKTQPALARIVRSEPERFEGRIGGASNNTL